MTAPKNAHLKLSLLSATVFALAFSVMGARATLAQTGPANRPGAAVTAGTNDQSAATVSDPAITGFRSATFDMTEVQVKNVIQ